MELLKDRRVPLKSGSGERWLLVASALVSLCITTSLAYAIPATTEVRVTDVTTSSFSVVWMTDVTASPSIEVYSDSAMSQRVIDGLSISTMPCADAATAHSALSKGIIKVRVSGAQAGTAYYIRTVTADTTNPSSIAYSPLMSVTTASAVSLYLSPDGVSSGFANDLGAFPVYIRPSEQQNAAPGQGDLLVLETGNASYPITAFVGEAATSPEGILDMNNLFGQTGANLTIAGNEVVTIRVYRAGALSTLVHYRRAPQNTGLASVVSFIPGFFADINLDEKIDDGDFSLFKSQYRSAPDDGTYNPDYKFANETDQTVGVRDFSKFSLEYGRTNVQ